MMSRFFHMVSTNQGLHAAAFSLMVFALYNLNLHAAQTIDTIPSTLLPVSMLSEGDLGLDEFERVFVSEPHLWRAGFIFGAMQESNGRVISSYPVGAALISTPIYAVAQAAGVLDSQDWAGYRTIGKLTASLFVSISAGILFLCLLHLGNSPRGALFLASAYALGTAAWAIVSQELWQHGPGMFCLSMALLFTLRLDHSAGHSRVLAIGLLLALAVLCRHLNAIPALVFGLYILRYYPRFVVTFSLPLLVCAAWVLPYNYQAFGNPMGGYEAIVQSDWHRSRGITTENWFTLGLVEGLKNTWLSPNKGILIYSPFLLFIVVAIFRWRKGEHRVKPFLCLWLLLLSIALAKNQFWWGGTSYGPRYFSEVSVAMVALLGISYQGWSVILKRTFALSVVLSIVIQANGALTAPCGWESSPNYAEFNQERYWQWNDMEIVRCARDGWHNGSKPPNYRFP